MALRAAFTGASASPTSAASGSCASTPPRASSACRTRELIAALDKANIALDRKILSDLAISDPAAFKKVVETARAAA